jgi:hypothetical protein
MIVMIATTTTAANVTLGLVLRVLRRAREDDHHHHYAPATTHHQPTNPPTHHPPPTTITHTQGNWDYFCRLVDRSGAVRWADTARTRIELIDGCALVYGGDAFDKGPGDHRISAALVGLKKSTPERTVLLIGNRDVNKMRLRSELHPTDTSRSVDTLPLPFWLGSSHGMTCVGDYFRQRACR